MFASCKNDSVDDQVLASYQDQILTMNDVQSQLSDIELKEDSTKALKRIKRDWFTKQIIITQAKKQLPPKETDLKQELLQYQSDLLYFKYVNYYVANKLKKQVSIAEIDSFYNKNSEILLTSEPLIRSVYIEVPKTVRDSYKIKNWIKSKNPKHQEKLNIFCYQHARVFDDFEGQWIPLSKLMKVTDLNNYYSNSFSPKQLILTETDSLKHFLYIIDVVKTGEVMPLDFADKKIIEMIVNMRKKKLQSELEQNISNKVDKIINQ